MYFGLAREYKIVNYGALSCKMLAGDIVNDVTINIDFGGSSCRRLLFSVLNIESPT